MMKTVFLILLIFLSAPVSAGIFDNFNTTFKLRLIGDISADCRIAPQLSFDIKILNPELTRVKPRGLKSYHSSIGALQGLAYMSYGFEIAFQFEHIRFGTQNCVRINSMDIRAGHKVPEVWIKPELGKNSCEFKNVVEHELQHVRNYHDHLRRFETSLRRELPLLLRGKSYINVRGSEEASTEYLKTKAFGLINRLHDRSQAISLALDRSIDTPEEYRRLSNLCR